MTDRFESILDESISALQAGVPIEDILLEVPEYAAELRPLLYAATVLADPNPNLAPEERKAALRAQYLDQATTLPAVAPSFGQKAQAVLRIIQKRTSPDTVISDLVTVSITIILTLAMTALILNFAANGALPGDMLYSVKRVSESVQRLFTFGQAQKDALEEQFNQRRLEEIEQLIQQQRAAVVEFRGILEAKGENLWIIAGYTIFLPEDIVVEGDPQEGDMVEVVGLLRTNNVLVADTIKIIK